jgi:hypothetical protein
MLAWAFPCKTPDEVGALLRALGKHRYVRDADLRIHWAVDAALGEREPFAAHARAFSARRKAERDLDPSSYDPSLWRTASADDVAAALSAFWEPGDDAREAAARLKMLLQHEGLPIAEHEPFDGDPEYPDHPALILLSWTLLPIEELDAERHAGALKAMADAGEEVDLTAPVEQEGPDIGLVELTRGASNGVLVADWLVWADGPYSYSDYVFRGACKMAKLPDPPEGLRDLDD